MGYWLSQLKNLPVGFDWYIFILGEMRNHSMINDFFRDDFSVISEAIGSDAALIAQSEKLENDFQFLLNKWSEADEKSRRRKVANVLENLRTRSPGLILLSKHPNEFKIKCDKFIYIPFSIIEKEYSSKNAILEDIRSFAKNENSNIVKKTIGKTFFNRIKPSISLGVGVIAINFDLE